MTVKQRQLLLAYLGYDPGTIDGLYGPKTRAAVKAFQQDFGGLTVDGVAGAATQKALRHAVAYGMPEREAVKPETGGKTEPGEAEKYLQADGCYHIPRGVDVQLSKNLWAHEVVCQGVGCCQESIISKRMVDTYQDIRDEYGDAIEIATAGGSGYRCDTHNREVGGAAGSLHKLGCAFDMHCRDKPKLLGIVERKITDGEIGVYSTFIHGGVWNRGYVNKFYK
nr:MAG TPA: peptidase [Caudoviricetes sp.]